MIKRTFDVAVALIVLVLCLPLLLVVFCMTLFQLGGPVFFCQQRSGLNGRPFIMYKFRTMTNGVDASGGELPDHQRLTPFGRKLRALSLDELPELWNVINGDMSLVGPRPLLMQYLPLYSPEQARRHEVKPGITGWAQINGRNALSWEEKFVLDVWYVDNRSFFLDIKVLWRTVSTVFFQHGIANEGHTTMPPFTGKLAAKN